MYTGRFAPSPTGLLHLGSLVTAIASYAEAKSQGGVWLVRIEDLDPPREVKGASQKIIDCLNNSGFKFSPPEFQSSNSHQRHYQQALEQLLDQGDVYYCTCSRKELKELGDQEHTCRQTRTKPNVSFSIKYKITDTDIEFTDSIQGPQSIPLTKKDDFVVFRKEGWFAYQLAVVVDDHRQNITHIVRGIDLLDSTPYQTLLRKSLKLNHVKHAHIPVLVNAEGQKLSKQTFAKEVNVDEPLNDLITSYSYLGQKPFDSSPKSVNEFWEHVVHHWNINNIPKVKQIKQIFS